MSKQMLLFPIYWGEWWVPAQNNSYKWAEVNGLMGTVVGGRYMDGLNQYGIERGSVGRTFVYPIDPPTFGFADVVVAVSQYWIDVSTMADLDDVCAAYALAHRRRLRVATKYAQLTRSFFAQARISDYRIVPSAGATEGAPAAGTAEVIVDITTTGATLRDNGLKILDDGVILKSQAQLAASLTADWSAEARKACETLLARLEADYPALAMEFPA